MATLTPVSAAVTAATAQQAKPNLLNTMMVEPEDSDGPIDDPVIRLQRRVQEHDQKKKVANHIANAWQALQHQRRNTVSAGAIG